MDESQAMCPLRFLLRKLSFVEEQTPFDKARVLGLREVALRKEPRFGADLMCGDFEKTEVLHYSHRKGSFTHSFGTDGAAAICIALSLAWTIDNRLCRSVGIFREIPIGSDKAIVLDGFTNERQRHLPPACQKSSSGGQIGHLCVDRTRATRGCLLPFHLDSVQGE